MATAPLLFLLGSIVVVDIVIVIRIRIDTALILLSVAIDAAVAAVTAATHVTAVVDGLL